VLLAPGTHKIENEKTLVASGTRRRRSKTGTFTYEAALLSSSSLSLISTTHPAASRPPRRVYGPVKVEMCA